VAEPADLPEAPAAEGGAVVADGDLWAAVAALPDKQRTAVALRFIADSAYAEIATAMEISEPAARRNVHEGLKRLREERPR
jgi:RNA polymerase sigma factor (sigma-70 family)